MNPIPIGAGTIAIEQESEARGPPRRDSLAERALVPSLTGHPGR
jgi:hypothetical protein